jgi:multiple sugar transport system permease protein
MLVAACLLIAAGCGPAKSPVTIKIWEFPRWRETPDSIDRFYWMRRQIAEFEEQHPGVSVELTELTWERGEDKKRIAIAAGVGPDLITGTLPVNLVENGLIEPVDAYMTPEERADFFGPALDAFTYDGNVYGWPWYLTGSVMFINRDLFERLDVDPPSPGWEYGEFLDDARRLTRDTNGDGKPDVYGFGFMIRPGDTDAWPFLFPDGVPFPPKGSAASAPDPEAVAGLERLHELIYGYRVAPVQCAAWDTEALWQRFTNQRDIAMVPWGIWAIPKLRGIEGFAFDVLPYPTLADSGEAAKAFIGTAGFMVLRQSDSQKRDLCMELARFLVRTDEQPELARYGVFPSRKSTGALYDGDPIMTRAQKIVASGQSVPRQMDWAKIDERLQREIQRALLDEKPIAAALADSAAYARSVAAKAAETRAVAPRGGHPDRMSIAIAAILVIGAVFTLATLLMARTGRMAHASTIGFLCPALVVFGVFMLFPLCWVGVLSFQEYSLAQGNAHWVGLQNLRGLLNDEAFVRAVLNTLIYTAVVVPANTFSALVVASLIYPLSDRLRSLFRGAYYLPGVASVVVIAMVWRWLFNENFGLLNTGLGFLGLPGVRWLTNPAVALWSVILTSIARPPGGPILIYLAALDAIPSSLHDAAEIDGAGPLRRWWNVTIPLLRPTTLFLALTMTIASFQVFAQVLILTDGGPGYATEVMVHRIYTAAIRDFDFGSAAAMSLVLFCVIMGVSVIQYSFFKSDFEY